MTTNLTPSPDFSPQAIATSTDSGRFGHDFESRFGVIENNRSEADIVIGGIAYELKAMLPTSKSRARLFGLAESTLSKMTGNDFENHVTGKLINVIHADSVSTIIDGQEFVSFENVTLYSGFNFSKFEKLVADKVIVIEYHNRTFDYKINRKRFGEMFDNSQPF